MIINLILQFWQNLNLPIRLLLIALTIATVIFLPKTKYYLELTSNIFDLWGLSITYTVYFVTEHLFLPTHNMNLLMIIYTIFLISDILVLIGIHIKTIIDVGFILSFPVIFIKLFAIVIPAILLSYITLGFILAFIFIFIFAIVISLLL